MNIKGPLSSSVARKILDDRQSAGGGGHGNGNGNGGAPLQPAQAMPERKPTAPLTVVIAGYALAGILCGDAVVPA